MTKKDIFGIEPKVGDILIFNPPKYKGLLYGTCIGFTDAGCPKVNKINGDELNNGYTFLLSIDKANSVYYSIKTDFCIK